MKRIILIIAVIFPFISIAQEGQEDCYVFYDPLINLDNAKIIGDISDYDNFSANIWITPHIVRYDDGSGGIDEHIVQSAVGQLNSTFMGIGINFMIGEFQYFNSTKYAEIDDIVEAGELMNMNCIDGTINVYFIPISRVGFKGVAKLPGTSCIIVNEYAFSSTFAHEICHNLW